MHNLFSIPLYIAKDNLETQKIAKEIYAIKQQKESVSISNDGGWQSESCELNLIDNVIIKHVTNYFEDLGNKNVDFEIIDQWANINPPLSSNTVHHHGGCDFSGVFYVSVPEQSGDLIIHNYNAPINNIIDIFPNASHCPTGHVLTPEQGVIILFPGNTLHSVSTNKSNKDRISIAFNIKVK